MQMNLSYEDAVMLWNDVVEMAHDCSDASMLPWLERLTPVSLENSVMTVSTRQNWTVRKIVGEYQPTIEALLQEITLEPISLQVVVVNTPGTAIVGASETAPAPVAAPVPVAAPAPVANPATAGAYIADTPAAAPAVEQPEQNLSPAALAGAARAAGRVGLFSHGGTGAGRGAGAPVPGEAPSPVGIPVQAAAPSPNAAPLQGSEGSGATMAAPQPFPSMSPASPAPAASVAQQPVFAPVPFATEPADDDVPRFETLAEPEIVAQDAVVPILEDGAVPKAAVNSGYSDFNFDTYIVGEANKLAFSMALAVAEQPGSVANLNPLFIWGPSGNGKTHLLFSILNYLHDHQPGMNVQYVAANAFVDQYVDDIRNKRLRGKEVLKAYRAVDVLLVDDVQFFEDKQESVSTFFDIFNQLILDGKQIVLVADTPPDYLTLDDRMRTRFSSGLVVDIKAPTYEMKRSILQSYYERCRARMDWCHVEIPPKLFETLTQLAPDNPRNMQGLMTSILLKANDDPNVLSPEGIKEVIKDLFKTTEAISVASIIRVVSDAYGVTADDIKGKPRTKNISEARQVVMWMARQLTDESYENIGAELGGRDHSTVYYGISTIEKRSLEDKSFLYKLERLKKEVVG